MRSAISPASSRGATADDHVGTRAAIEVVSLEKRYGDTRAVDGLSLEVGEGAVFGLLGPNGAGKTTTVEVLEGYRRADAGEVRVLGLDPWRDGASLRPRLGVMLQEGGLYLAGTVGLMLLPK